MVVEGHCSTMPEGEGWPPPGVQDASHRSCSREVEGVARMQRSWRWLRVAAAGCVLSVMLVCLVDAPAKTRNFGDMLVATRASGRARSATPRKTGRLQEMTEAQDRMLRTAQGEGAQKGGLLPASILKMQASNWAQEEARSLAASLASAIQKTGHVQPTDDYRKDLADTLRVTDPVRAEEQQAARESATETETENHHLALFSDAPQHSAVQHTPATRVSSEVQEEAREQEFEEENKQMFKVGDVPTVVTRSKSPAVHNAVHESWQSPKPQPAKQDGIETFANSHSAPALEHSSQAAVPSAFDWFAEANERGQTESGPKLAAPPLPTSVTFTGDAVSAVPASVLQIFKEQAANDAAEAAQEKAANGALHTASAQDQKPSGFVWPARAAATSQPLVAVAARKARHKGKTGTPKVAVDKWVKTGRGLNWPRATARAVRASPQQRAVHAQSIPANDHQQLISQPENQPSLREKVEEAREAMYTQKGRSLVLVTMPRGVLRKKMRQLNAKLSIVQQALSRGPPVVVVAPDGHPGVHKRQQQVGAHASVGKQWVGLESLDTPLNSTLDIPLVIVPPGAPVPPAAEVTAPATPAPAHSEPAVVIVPPGGPVLPAVDVSVPAAPAPSQGEPAVIIVSPSSSDPATPPSIASPAALPAGVVEIVPPTPITFVGPLHHTPNFAASDSAAATVPSVTANADIRSTSEGYSRDEGEQQFPGWRRNPVSPPTYPHSLPLTTYHPTPTTPLPIHHTLLHPRHSQKKKKLKFTT